LVAAVVLTAAGAAGGLATAGLLFGLSVLLLLAVRVRSVPAQEGERSTWDDFCDGLRYLRRNRRLIRLVLIIGACELCFSGPIAVGLVLLADERQWSAAVLGSILTTFSIGGAGAAILLIVMNRIPRAGLTLICSLLLTAVLLTWIGRSADPGTAIALSAALGLISGVAMTVGNALLQKQTDERYLGRVSSVLALCTFGLSPLLYPLVGLTADAGGTAVFFAGCGLIWLLATVASGASRAIRSAVL
jgi:hypothetical protein